MTFDEIYNQIISDWCNRVGITVEEAGYTMIIVSKVFTFGLYLLNKLIIAISNNVWVGSMQAFKLIEVGTDKIGRPPYEATKGEYLCSTTIKNSGGVIPTGTQFTFEILGVIYKYESTQDVNAGDSIPIRALTAGIDSSLNVSDILTSQQELSVAENNITVTSITEEPLEAETIEEYRAIVVAYERLRLGNGNASDYIFWVSNVNGLRTSFPYTAPNEAGKAKIYCESSDEEVLVPSAALITDAIDAIKYDADGISQPPVEFFQFVNDTYVLPVQITGIKLEITNGDSGQLASIQELIRDYLLKKRPFLFTLNREPQITEGFNSLENTVTLVDIIQLLANSNITFTNIDLQVNILNAASYQSLSTYVVGYRGGSTFPPDYQTSSEPTLSTYYGECPRLEDITFV